MQTKSRIASFRSATKRSYSFEQAFRREDAPHFPRFTLSQLSLRQLFLFAIHFHAIAHAHMRHNPNFFRSRSFHEHTWRFPRRPRPQFPDFAFTLLSQMTNSSRYSHSPHLDKFSCLLTTDQLSRSFFRPWYCVKTDVTQNEIEECQSNVCTHCLRGEPVLELEVSARIPRSFLCLTPSLRTCLVRSPSEAQPWTTTSFPVLHFGPTMAW